MNENTIPFERERERNWGTAQNRDLRTSVQQDRDKVKVRIQFLPVPIRNPPDSTVRATAGQVSRETPVPSTDSCTVWRTHRVSSRRSAIPLGMQRHHFQPAVLHELSQSLVCCVSASHPTVICPLSSVSASFVPSQQCTTLGRRAPRSAQWTRCARLLLSPVLRDRPLPATKPPPTRAGAVTRSVGAGGSFIQDTQALTACLVSDKRSGSLRKDLRSLEKCKVSLSLSGVRHCSLLRCDKEQVWVSVLKSLSIFHTLKTNKAAKR